MPIARGFAFIRPLPNAGSQNHTLTSKYFDHHYESLQLLDRWTWDRYARFCQVARFTPYEMASLVLMRHEAVESFKKRNRIGGDNARAVALLLTLIEAHLLKNLTSDIVADPFPDLNSIPH